MLHVAFFSLAIFLPWLLGFFIIKPFLKQRNGYLSFAIGVGYVLGWFVSTLILRVYDYFQRPFDIYEMVVTECVLVIPLLLLKARNLRSNEVHQIDDEPVSKLIWLMTSFIVLLLFYRWGLTLIDLLNKPVFPWDGWMSWSAKAKVFYYTKEIFPLAWDGTRFWEINNKELALVGGARHPYFISLIQTYTALAWGGWSDSIVNLPWLGMSIAMFFCVYGGLRYLNMRLFPALLTSYMTVNLPIFDIHFSLGSYADLWVGFSILIVSLILVMVLVLKENKLLFPLLFFLLITYLIKNTALVFLLGLMFVLYWYWFGKVASVILLVLLAFVLYGLSSWVMSVDLYKTLVSLLASGLPRDLISYNPVVSEVMKEWIMLDNWHYVFIASLFGLVLLFMRVDSKNKQFLVLVLVGYAFLLVMLVLTFLTHKISGENFVAYFNRVSLYFIPVYGLIPVSMYHLLNKSLNGRYSLFN